MPRDYDDDDNFDRDIDRRRSDVRDEELGTSAFGVTSFVLALLAGLLVAIMIISVTVMTINAGGQRVNEQSPEMMMMGCAVILGLGMAVLGLILGLIGVVGQFRGKILASFGLAINALIVLGVIALMVIGLAAK